MVVSRKVGPFKDSIPLNMKIHIYLEFFAIVFHVRVLILTAIFFSKLKKAIIFHILILHRLSILFPTCLLFI